MIMALKRFEFDFETMNKSKVNDYFGVCCDHTEWW